MAWYYWVWFGTALPWFLFNFTLLSMYQGERIPERNFVNLAIFILANFFAAALCAAFWPWELELLLIKLRSLKNETANE